MLCPRCKSKGGFFTRLVATYQQYYDFDGAAVYATEPNIIRGGQVAYCAECEYRLGYVNIDSELMTSFARYIPQE